MSIRVLRGWVPVVAVVGLLMAAAVAAAFSSVRVGLEPLDEPTGRVVQVTEAPAPPPTQAAHQESDPGPLVKVVLYSLLALGVLVVAALVLLVVRKGLRRLAAARPGFTVRREPANPIRRPPSSQRAVAEVVDSGLNALAEADGDARRAVIGCWVRLEQAAAGAGAVRQPGDTSTDLVARLLAAHHVSGPVLDRFAAVYRQARYATTTVDEQMRLAATDALARIRTELATPRAATPPDAGLVDDRPANDRLARSAGDDVVAAPTPGVHR